MYRFTLLLIYITISITSLGQLNFIGTWEKGGNNHLGSIFSLNNEGSNYKILHEFPPSLVTSPTGELCKWSKNEFYGLTQHKTNEHGGVIFKYSHTKNSYSIIHEFKGDEGWGPESGLIKYKGLLYGVTLKGGNYNCGTLFSINPKSKELEILHHFKTKNATRTNNSKSKLIKIKNHIYGNTNLGGDFGKGSLFKFNLISKQFSLCISFNDSIGVYPKPIIILSKKKIIGCLLDNDFDDSNEEKSKLFEFDPRNNSIINVLSFDTVSGYRLNSQLIEYKPSTLVGITSNGGEFGDGVLFEFNLKKREYSPIIHMNEKVTGKGNNGQFITIKKTVYGFLENGGEDNHGVLFSYKNNQYSIIKSLNNKQTNKREFRITPYNKSTIIGLNSSQSRKKNSSNIFTYNLKNKVHKQFINFNECPDGEQPIGQLIQYKEYMYGVTKSGGIRNSGILYRIKISSNKFEKLIDFGNQKFELYVRGGLALSESGELFGVLTQGIKGNSCLYKYSISKKSINYFTTSGLDSLDYYQKGDKNGQFHNISRTNNITKNIFPTGTPTINNNVLYCSFISNNYPDRYGIFRFDIKDNSMNIVTSFKKNGLGSFYPKDDYLFFINGNYKLDSISINCKNCFDSEQKGPETSFLKGYNSMNDLYFIDGSLFNYKQKYAKPKLILNMVMAKEWSVSKSKKDYKTYGNKYYELDLANVYNTLIENEKPLDTLSQIITGTSPSNPFIVSSNKKIYGINANGGQYSGGVFLEYTPKTHSVLPLFHFLETGQGYGLLTEIKK